MPNQSHEAHSRRQALRLIGLGAAATLVAPFGRTAEAQPASAAPATDVPQGSGFYRFKVGELDCAIVSDGGFTARPSDLFPDVGDDELAEAADKGFIAPGYLPMSINALLVRTGSAVVLIDAGAADNMGPLGGKLVGNLARLGVKPDDVTHVIVSHVHPDHAGGLLTTEGTSQFAKARVIVGEAEHAFWTGDAPTFPESTLVKPEMQQGMIAGAKKILGVVKDQLELHKPGDVIAGALTLLDAAGHTPGMVAVLVESGDASALYVADTMHVLPIQMPHPEWNFVFDRDPAEGAKMRKQFMSTAASTRVRVVGPHLPFPSIGHIVKDGNAFRWVPQLWEW